MIGITSYSTYIPRYRLEREKIARVWNQDSFGGERSVANYDEDSFTMAAESALDCLGDNNPKEIGGLFFASTTSPYSEKLVSSMLSTVIGMDTKALTGDVSGATRCGSIALKAAFDSIRCATTNNIIVAVSDCRMGEPGSDLEPILGDGATAIQVGNSGVIASLEGEYVLSNEINDYWRLLNGKFVRAGDNRFIWSYGYLKTLKEVLTDFLKQSHFQIKDFTNIVVSYPDHRAYSRLVKEIGLKKNLIQDDLFKYVGNTGSAFGPMLLISVLEKSTAGDLVLYLDYGSGCSAFIFKIQKEIEILKKKKKGISAFLENKKELPSYERFLEFKRLIDKDNPAPPPFSTSALLWKESKQNFGLYGVQCNKCSYINFPIRRICPNCGSKDNFKDFRLSKHGEVFTFTKDRVFPSPDPPLVMAVIDLRGGGRIYTQMADCDENEVHIGAKTELTLRKYHQGGGYNNYFWKARLCR